MVGSWTHGMLPAVMLLCVVVGLAVARWSKVVPWLLFAQLASLIYVPVIPNSVDLAFRQRLMHEAAAAPGQFLSRCLSCAYLNGRAMPDNLATVNLLVETTGLWDGGRIVRAVQRQLYDPIIISESYGSEAIRQAMLTQYALTEVIANDGAAESHPAYIYRPKPRANQRAQP
jgi:hypothetical protein